ncbi:MAG: hypothetical protein HQL37_15545 [Alphaproteobacteria bacterium]|nr:hypothetical protein [Alphaproteobacteria bacterium]
MADDPRVHAALKAAVKQLEAAVREQEGAVERILGLVEILMSRAPAGPVYLKLEAIMEACAFQDITGQRIRKVSRLLKALADQGTLSAPLPVESQLPAKQGLSQADVDRLLSGK